MADTFEIVSQRLTQELVGGHDLIDVWEIGARTRPRGIYFVFRVGEDEHEPERVGAEAERLAEQLEALASHEAVEQVAYVQSIASNGQLADELDVHYMDAGGRHRGVVRVPLPNLNAELTLPHIEAQVAHMLSVARL